jgi:gluconate transporter
LTDAWPAVCTAAALVLLLVLIIRFQFQAFAALLVVSLGLGLAAGMAPEAVVRAVGEGVGTILRGVALVLGLGAMLGRMLEASGAAEVIAQRILRTFGPTRAPAAILLAAYLIGIPVFFNVGFLLLIPIMWRLQRETGQSLLWFVLPLSFSLATTHSLVPPHPGIVVTVGNFRADMMETIIFGSLLGVPVALAGWLGPGRWWARRQFVGVPEHLAAKPPLPDTARADPLPAAPDAKAGVSAPPSFALALLIVLLPLLLSVVGFGASLLGAPQSALVVWLRFIGDPLLALALPTGLAYVLLGWRRGMTSARLSKLAGEALQDVGGMALLIGAAGAFSAVINQSGAGPYIAGLVRSAPLSPLVSAYLVAVLMRAALGSATAAIATASGLLAALAHELPGQEMLLVMAVANGVTFMTQPGDSGFWLIKEYCNLSVNQVMFAYNACRATMSLTGLALLLLYEALRG